MSIRPVDMQILVQKTPEISKTSQTENQRPEMAQQEIVSRMNKETQLNEQRVVQTVKSEQDQIDKDGRGGASRGSSGKKSRNQEQERREEKKSTSSSALFDVSI